MMNGFALLCAVTALFQTDVAGWDIDKEDGKLQYVIHLNDQDVEAMRPTRPDTRPSEVLAAIPPYLQGRFARIVVRINPSPAPRVPSVDAIPTKFPLMVSASGPATVSLRQDDTAGWEIDQEDNSLMYVIHLTEQDLADMTPRVGQATLPAEVVAGIPATLQARFTKVVIRVDSRNPPRDPVEDLIKTRFPLLIPGAPQTTPSTFGPTALNSPTQLNGTGTANLAGAGFANIDSSPDRDRNTPAVRPTSSNTSAGLTDLAQAGKGFAGGAFGSSNNPLTAGRDRDAPTTNNGFASSTSSTGTGALGSSTFGPNNGSGTYAPNRDPVSLSSPTSTFGANSQTGGMGSMGQGSTGTGFANNGMSSTPTYNGQSFNNGTNYAGSNGFGNNGVSSNGFGNNGFSNSGFGNNGLATGALNTYGNTATGYPNGNSSPFVSAPNYNASPNYASSPALLNNGFGAMNNGYNTSFAAQNGYGTGYNPATGSLYGPETRVASLPGAASSQQVQVPFPTTTTAPTPLPLPANNSGVAGQARNARTWDTSNWQAEEGTRSSFLPILFILSFVVNVYAGLYLFKLRDKCRTLSSSLRAGVEP